MKTTLAARSLNLAALLRIPFQSLIVELHERLAAAGFPDVRPAHTMIFAHVGRDGIGLTALAERAQLSKQDLNHLVNAMQARGYVERVPDPSDGRARIVRLTARGQIVARTGAQIIDDIELEWAARLRSGAMQELRRALEDLGALVTYGPAPRGED